MIHEDQLPEFDLTGGVGSSGSSLRNALTEPSKTTENNHTENIEFHMHVIRKRVKFSMITYDVFDTTQSHHLGRKSDSDFLRLEAGRSDDLRIIGVHTSRQTQDQVQTRQQGHKHMSNTPELQEHGQILELLQVFEQMFRHFQEAITQLKQLEDWMLKH